LRRLFGNKDRFYLTLFVFENVRVTKIYKKNYALFRMNFYPMASNLPPSIIFLFAKSSSLESFISTETVF